MEEPGTGIEEPGSASAVRAPGLASITTDLPDVGPEALLAAGRGRPRAWWAREGRWSVHLGAVAEVTASPGEAGEPAEARFDAVRERAGALLDALAPEEGDGARPRLVGGFSFHGEPTEDALWEGFPPGRLILPEIEVRGGSGEPRAIVTAGIPPRGSVEDGFARARRRLDALRRALAAGAGEPADDALPELEIREPPRGSWEEVVEEILREIDEGRLEKAVLARTLDLAADVPLDPLRVALRLGEQNPGSTIFLVEPRPGAAVVGAAPEVVARVEGDRFHHTAVAGSAARSSDADADERLGRELLESPKDRAEHEVCVRDAVSRLRGRIRALAQDPGPHLLKLSGIQHLETRLDGEVDRGTHVLSLVGALHPTPAVSGYPRDAALELLGRVEPFERGWYAGPVGWCDARGEGCFVPALRSAVIRDGRARLFAGSGIVRGSDPGREWEETGLKFEPVLRALGVH